MNTSIHNTTKQYTTILSCKSQSKVSRTQIQEGIHTLCQFTTSTIRIHCSDHNITLYSGAMQITLGKNQSTAIYKSPINSYTIINDTSYCISNDGYILANRIPINKQQFTQLYIFKQQLLAITNNNNQLINITKGNILIADNVKHMAVSHTFYATSTTEQLNIIGYFPFQLQFKQSINKIQCGSNHILVLTDSHSVYTWGKGTNGQLGNGLFKDQFWPILMAEEVQDIAAGQECSLLLKDNKLYQCGTNELIQQQSVISAYEPELEHIVVKIWATWSPNNEVIYADCISYDDQLFDVFQHKLQQFNQIEQLWHIPTDLSDESLLTDEPLLLSPVVLKEVNVVHKKPVRKTPIKKLRFVFD